MKTSPHVEESQTPSRSSPPSIIATPRPIAVTAPSQRAGVARPFGPDRLGGVGARAAEDAPLAPQADPSLPQGLAAAGPAGPDRGRHLHLHAEGGPGHDLDRTGHRRQARGGKGVTGTDLREGDFIEHLFVASTHSYILFFTTNGKVYWLKVHQIPQAGAAARGPPGSIRREKKTPPRTSPARPSIGTPSREPT